MEKFITDVIFPKIAGDGGWVEFAGYTDGVLTLVFRGECSKCGILSRCTEWIEAEALRVLHKKIRVNAIRKKPYFQDK